jgi:hypothetical protein
MVLGLVLWVGLIAKINEFLIVGKAVEAQKRATCPIT